MAGVDALIDSTKWPEVYGMPTQNDERRLGAWCIAVEVLADAVSVALAHDTAVLAVATDAMRLAAASDHVSASIEPDEVAVAVAACE